MRAALAMLALAALALGAAACGVQGRGSLPRVVTGGDPQTGRQLIRAFGCGSCHIIPGVRGARGMVGPPLIHFAQRTYIGGEAPNTPENLIRWLRSPQSIEPGTAMPNLGLDDGQARAIAAYLYRLH